MISTDDKTLMDQSNECHGCDRGYDIRMSKYLFTETGIKLSEYDNLFKALTGVRTGNPNWIPWAEASSARTARAPRLRGQLPRKLSGQSLTSSTNSTSPTTRTTTSYASGTNGRSVQLGQLGLCISNEQCA